MATNSPASPLRLTPNQEPTGLLTLIRQGLARPGERWTIVGAVGCLALLGLIFESNLRHFVLVWSNDGNYSHGFLVPLIGLYFAHLAAQRGAVAVRSGVKLGLCLLALSILGRMATILIPVGVVGDLSFLFGLAGVCALLLGTDVLRRYWFTFFFLIFMIPLPVALYARIASPLQLMVSQFATETLNATGVPVLREGNMMTLPGGIRMFVAEACSGMRQLTGFLALTVAVAYMSMRPGWYRLAVIVSSVPIAMTANIARVVLTGYIMWVNPEYASGAYHTAEGLLMMGFGLSLLRAECWMLDQVLALVHAAPSPGVAPGPIRSGVGRGSELVNHVAATLDRGPAGTSSPEVPDGLQRNDHGRLLEQGWTT
jgi:exosortase